MELPFIFTSFNIILFVLPLLYHKSTFDETPDWLSDATCLNLQDVRQTLPMYLFNLGFWCGMSFYIVRNAHKLNVLSIRSTPIERCFLSLYILPIGVVAFNLGELGEARQILLCATVTSFTLVIALIRLFEPQRAQRPSSLVRPCAWLVVSGMTVGSFLNIRGWDAWLQWHKLGAVCSFLLSFPLIVAIRSQDTSAFLCLTGATLCMLMLSTNAWEILGIVNSKFAFEFYGQLLLSWGFHFSVATMVQ